MTTTATQTSIGSMIAAGLRMAIGYGTKLCEDVPADKFGHMPHPNMNSALFNMAHLTIYTERCLQMIGREDLAQTVDPKWEEQFKNGAQCVEQDGRYPGKEAIMKRYVERYTVVASALDAADDAVFTKPNPMGGRMTEMLPTMGAAVMFLCGSHMQMHLGQVSAWRRAMGMGSIM
ncbi:MAG: DinB family protein [Planctomycetes bacterium]|jgi:hypothetical protein|nr:DinB family protein [Planctomycetota bacterium]